MAEIIQDGTGKSYGAKVDSDGRLHVDSISTDRESYSSQSGYSFNLNTGLITLTNAATDNAVMYVKNNEAYPLVITNVFYQTGALQVYDLKTELFEYSNERFQTGISAIDTFFNAYKTTDVTSLTTLKTRDPIAKNIDFEDEKNDVIDFTEIDPFSETITNPTD